MTEIIWQLKIIWTVKNLHGKFFVERSSTSAEMYSFCFFQSKVEEHSVQNQNDVIIL